MSVQFGRWNLDGMPIEPTYLAKVKTLIAPYGPDDEGAYAASNLSILYHSFHTTKESRRERQPHVGPSGLVVTWDGRLDNRAELLRRLSSKLANSATDVSIVTAAYSEWGSKCFLQLVGDWALSIWDAESHSLTLAKDPIGTRQLYYSINKDQVTWSTILEPLLLFAGKTFALCEEYIAGWFSFFPAAHLTPYIGVHSVPPSSSVFIRIGNQTITKYWDFDPLKQIRYHTDAEYEEHFRAVFDEAVRRRLRSDSPILAELSGGMDSSSIVCMADNIIAHGATETPRLDTISYYNDSEPNWNERPYFIKVEEKRGRAGFHIDMSQESFEFALDNDHFAATPTSGVGPPSEASRQIEACIASQGNRVVLSGTGGDEFNGGVPTPLPELQDLLARGHFRILAHQLKSWALNKRKPWFHLLFEAVRGFLPPTLVGVPKYKRPAPWFNPAFVNRNRAALTGYDARTKLCGPLPSFQGNAATLDVLRRQIACSTLSLDPLHEKRYPYLDRGLLEFLCAIPAEQLVRPGQRRSLMRRALTGIVPDELLHRKRKAFVSRSPRMAIEAAWQNLLRDGQHMLTNSLGITDSKKFVEALQNTQQGAEVLIIPLMRTLGIELWLRSLATRHVVDEATWLTHVAIKSVHSRTDGANPMASNVQWLR
jgi:asparagine synthase (glutamine-hydrolysing)